MTTPDPSMPDPNTAPPEPIEHLLARIEAAGRLLHNETPVICPAGCEMLPTGIPIPGTDLPRAVGYDHQISCSLYGT